MRHLALAVLAASPAMASPCVREQVSHVDFGQVRGRPGLGEARLWQLPDGSIVDWCGEWSTDSSGREWHFISFRAVEEPWIHKGWVSSRILEQVTDAPAVVVVPAPAPKTVTTTTTTVITE
jgi:hypothetical protein